VIVTFSTTHFFAQNDTFQLKTVEIISGEFKAIKQNVATFETDYSKSDFKIK